MIASIIDIGTNSCRMMIADDKNNKVNTLIKLVELTRLGEGVNKRRKLSPEAIARTLKVLKNFREVSDSYSSEKILAFATSAVRDSENREEFIDLVKLETGIQIECISGQEEGKASFVGGTSFLEKNDSKILLIDMGGGSTEFSYGIAGKIPDHIKSLDIGVVRFKEMMENGNFSFSDLENLINQELKKIDFIGENYELMGVAASITGQIAIFNREAYDPVKAHNQKLTLKMIESNFNMLKNMTKEEILSLPSLSQKRADVILPGTFLLLKILEFLKKDFITTSEIDLLEGHFILKILKSELVNCS